MTTRAWLKNAIVGYVHDSGASITAALDTFIDIGAARVGQKLRCREMEATRQRLTGAPDSWIELGTNIKEVLAVSWRRTEGRWINLESIGAGDAWMYSGIGLQPGVYFIESNRVYPLPFTDADYQAEVLALPVVPVAEDETTAALTAYPFLFLNAAIVEAQDWKQDTEMVTRYENKWIAEAEVISANYERTRRGASLAMRAQ